MQYCIACVYILLHGPAALTTSTLRSEALNYTMNVNPCEVERGQSGRSGFERERETERWRRDTVKHSRHSKWLGMEIS